MNKHVVDPFEATCYADVADHREEDEAEVDLALHLPELFGRPTSHDKLVRRAPPLTGHDELVGGPEVYRLARQRLSNNLFRRPRVVARTEMPGGRVRLFAGQEKTKRSCFSFFFYEGKQQTPRSRPRPMHACPTNYSTLFCLLGTLSRCVSHLTKTK